MLRILMAVTALLIGQAASASTLDFASEAELNGERGGTESLFLDGVRDHHFWCGWRSLLRLLFSGGKPGGLGVCSPA